MKTLKNVLSVIVLVLVVSAGILIGVDNNGLQHLTLLEWSSPELPLYQWLLMFFGLGFILGLIAMLKPLIRLQLQRGKLQRELNKLKARSLATEPLSVPQKPEVSKIE